VFLGNITVERARLHYSIEEGRRKFQILAILALAIGQGRPAHRLSVRDPATLMHRVDP